MVNKNTFLQFLYLLSKTQISKFLYLEGGAALSFVYGCKRVFSNDIDFTIVHSRLVPQLINTLQKVSIDSGLFTECTLQCQQNKIVIFSRKKPVIQIDFYVLPTDLFLSENKKLVYKNQEFFVKAHSLEDIFAEKITNVLQKDRTEFKDIMDINIIYKVLFSNMEDNKFRDYLQKKLVGKRIYNKREKMILVYLNKIERFKKSYYLYDKRHEINFNNKFFYCQKVIERYL